MDPPFHHTFVYKQIEGVEIKLDLYPPKRVSWLRPKVPAVVYFHGGGMAVGSREAWLPRWLLDRVTEMGYAFISADHQLIPSSTGHDILRDILDLFTFLGDDLNTLLDQSQSPVAFHIDPENVAVSGTSSGGLCAYIAAMHAVPKPKALLGMYAGFGDWLTDHYLTAKTKPFFMGRDLLDPEPFEPYLHPASAKLPVTSVSPLSYAPASAPIPGYPTNPRMLLSRIYLQLGVYLDYWLGEHEPSISATLRAHLGDTAVTDKEALLRTVVPARHHGLFPQLGVTADWPPTLLVHGSLDTVVPIHDSKRMCDLLRRAGVQARLEVVEGEEHSFDYGPKADTLYAGTFDRAAQFLQDCLDPRCRLVTHQDLSG
jgi:acetyl esterase/lipase